MSSFQRYHRVLNRDVWSSLQLSRILLRLFATAFVPDGPLVFGIDGTINVAAEPIAKQPASKVIRCAPVTATWSRPMVSGGAASCSWFPFPGRHAPGRCPS